MDPEAMEALLRPEHNEILYREALQAIHREASNMLFVRGDANPHWGMVSKLDRIAFKALERAK